MPVCAMRAGVVVEVSASDRARLEAVVRDRGGPQPRVWRIRVGLRTAGGVGASEIRRQAGVAKTAGWRWQERCRPAGVDGLLRGKTRPSHIAPLASNG